MEVAGSSDMLVNINQTTRRHIQTDSNLHSRRLENLYISPTNEVPMNMALHYTALHHLSVEKPTIFSRIAVYRCILLFKHSYRPQMRVCIHGNKKILVKIHFLLNCCAV
jgi:hypothetical protein